LTLLLSRIRRRDNGFVGEELVNARYAHARLGYNFYVQNISARASVVPNAIDVSVALVQGGVAPFYYDISLAMLCPGVPKLLLGGVKTLDDQYEANIFTFTGIPTTAACLNDLSLSLESSYAYARRPIKFAQGTGKIRFRLPPPGGWPPVVAPVVFDPYYTLNASALGAPNPDAAIGNPMKGLMESPIYTIPPYAADIPLSLEFYYFGK
jgi:hypothetical protein